ncbi:MAG: hypothetical protein KGS09_13195 [Nitrospirae bacterium]|nr:hypothetical protein [Nitrospirota bacterium]
MSTTPPDVLTKQERYEEWLPIDSIHVNESLFQPRNLHDTDTKTGSEAQIETMLKQLENGEVLDPIEVWKWQGRWWEFNESGDQQSAEACIDQIEGGGRAASAAWRYCPLLR